MEAVASYKLIQQFRICSEFLGLANKGTWVPMAANILALWVWRELDDDVNPLFLVALIQLELSGGSIGGGSELQTNPAV